MIGAAIRRLRGLWARVSRWMDECDARSLRETAEVCVAKAGQRSPNEHEAMRLRWLAYGAVEQAQRLERRP
jgi:hypothetical protein